MCGVRNSRRQEVLDRPRRSLLDHIFRIFPVKRFLWKEITRRKNLQSLKELQSKKDIPNADKFAPLNSIADVRYSSASKQRLLFGNPVIPGEFPWFSSLEWDGVHICPATIITRLHALTSATCLNKHLAYQHISRLKLVVLEHNLDLLDPQEFRVEVKLVTLHPDFNTRDFPLPRNDLGVVTLSSPLTWSEILSPVCWGPLSPPPTTTLLYISWGETQYGPASAPHWASLPAISSQQCEASLSILLESSQLCAGPGRGQEEPCQVRMLPLVVKNNINNIL